VARFSTMVFFFFFWASKDHNFYVEVGRGRSAACPGATPTRNSHLGPGQAQYRLALVRGGLLASPGFTAAGEQVGVVSLEAKSGRSRSYLESERLRFFLPMRERVRVT